MARSVVSQVAQAAFSAASRRPSHAQDRENPVRDEPKEPKGFRTCGACRRRWSTAEEFLDDAEVSVLGLQVAGHVPEANLIVFDCACGSSVSVLVDRLRFLQPEPLDGSLGDLFGSEQCKELCLELEDWTS